MGRTFLYTCASSCEGMTVTTCRGTTREDVFDEEQTGVLGRLVLARGRKYKEWFKWDVRSCIIVVRRVKA